MLLHTEYQLVKQFIRAQSDLLTQMLKVRNDNPFAISLPAVHAWWTELRNHIAAQLAKGRERHELLSEEYDKWNYRLNELTYKMNGLCNKLRTSTDEKAMEEYLNELDSVCRSHFKVRIEFEAIESPPGELSYKLHDGELPFFHLVLC